MPEPSSTSRPSQISRISTLSQKGRTSIVEFFTGGSSRSDEGAWMVGGRYEVLRDSSVYADEELYGNPVSSVKVKDRVLMLDFVDADQSKLGTPVAFVLPSDAQQAGWMQLQDDTDDPKNFFLWRQRLAGSWEMAARYRVKHPATLREGKDLTSPIVSEVSPGAEVLVLHIGVYRGSDTEMLRLRLQVSTDTGTIGWLSPQTVRGERLLDPVNLLGKDMLLIHRHSVQINSKNSGAIKRLSFSGQLDIQSMTVDQLPWEVGAQYRVLEKVSLRKSEDLSAKQIGKIEAGEIVSVLEMANTSCPNLRRCPVAHVLVISGKMQDQHGWIRCAEKDGRDVIDVRDQLEFEKVQAKIKQAAQQEQERKARAVEQSRLAISGRSLARPSSPGVITRDTEDLNESSSSPRSVVSEVVLAAMKMLEATEDEPEEREEKPEEWSAPGGGTPPGRPPARSLEGMKELKLPAGVEKHAPHAPAKFKWQPQPTSFIPTWKVEEVVEFEKPTSKVENGSQLRLGALGDGHGHGNGNGHNLYGHFSEWARKLQDQEIGSKEEKVVDDKTTIVDEKLCCGCNCSAPSKVNEASRK